MSTSPVANPVPPDEARIELKGDAFREYVQDRIAGRMFVKLSVVVSTIGGIVGLIVAYGVNQVIGSAETLKEEIKNEMQADIKSQIEDLLPGQIAHEIITQTRIEDELDKQVEEVSAKVSVRAVQDILGEKNLPKLIEEIEKGLRETDRLNELFLANILPRAQTGTVRQRAKAIELIPYFAESPARIRSELLQIAQNYGAHKPAKEIIEAILDNYPADDPDPNLDRKMLTIILDRWLNGTDWRPHHVYGYARLLAQLGQKYYSELAYWLRSGSEHPARHLVLWALLQVNGDGAIVDDAAPIRVLKELAAPGQEQDAVSDMAWEALAAISPDRAMDSLTRQEAWSDLWSLASIADWASLSEGGEIRSKLTDHLELLAEAARNGDAERLNALMVFEAEQTDQAVLDLERLRAIHAGLRADPTALLTRPAEAIAADIMDDRRGRRASAETRALVNLLRIDAEAEDWSRLIQRELAADDQQRAAGAAFLWARRIAIDGEGASPRPEVEGAADDLVRSLLERAGKDLPTDSFVNAALRLSLPHVGDGIVAVALEEWETRFARTPAQADPRVLAALLARDAESAQPYAESAKLLKRIADETRGDTPGKGLLQHVDEALALHRRLDPDVNGPANEAGINDSAKVILSDVTDDLRSKDPSRLPWVHAVLEYLHPTEPGSRQQGGVSVGPATDRQAQIDRAMEDLEVLPLLRLAIESVDDPVERKLRARHPHIGDRAWVEERDDFLRIEGFDPDQPPQGRWHAEHVLDFSKSSDSQVLWRELSGIDGFEYRLQGELPEGLEVAVWNEELTTVLRREVVETAGGEVLETADDTKVTILGRGDCTPCFLQFRLKEPSPLAAKLELFGLVMPVDVPAETSCANPYPVRSGSRYRVPMGSSQEHCFAIDVNMGDLLIAETSELSPDVDTTITLRDPEALELGYDDDGGDYPLASRLQHRATTDQTLMLMIADITQTSFEDDSYTLELALRPRPVPDVVVAESSSLPVELRPDRLVHVNPPLGFGSILRFEAKAGELLGIEASNDRFTIKGPEGQPAIWLDDAESSALEESSEEPDDELRSLGYILAMQSGWHSVTVSADDNPSGLLLRLRRSDADQAAPVWLEASGALQAGGKPAPLTAEVGTGYVALAQHDPSYLRLEPIQAGPTSLKLDRIKPQGELEVELHRRNGAGDLVKVPIDLQHATGNPIEISFDALASTEHLLMIKAGGQSHPILIHSTWGSRYDGFQVGDRAVLGRHEDLAEGWRELGSRNGKICWLHGDHL